MKKSICLLGLVFAASTVFAQVAKDDQDAIAQTINALFDGMRQSDSMMVRNSFDVDAIMQTVRTEKTGEGTVLGSSLSRFVSQIGGAQPGMLDERITFEKIMVDGPLAIAWTPYQFYLDGKFSHCGVNVFQLVKKADGWKIVSVIDTRRKEHCVQ